MTERSEAAPGRTRPDDAAAWSALMARAQDGDQVAYRRLLEDITPYLRSLAARHRALSGEVEDAVQDILLTVHAVRHTYDPGRPFGPWLVAIARRRIVDRLRRRGRQAAAESALGPEHETIAATEPNLFGLLSGRRGLREAIGRLPPGQRQAVLLLKLHGLSLKEAASESGMSVAALKVASHRGLKTLRAMFGNRM
ncbi:MAG: sigma-70 family RNA polymerase sigma factor [Geminicoccaceae bacterium]